MKKKLKTGKITTDIYFTKPAKLGDKVIITKEYFYNGEGHVKGYIENQPKMKFDCPDIFVDIDD